MILKSTSLNLTQADGNCFDKKHRLHIRQKRPFLKMMQCFVLLFAMLFSSSNIMAQCNPTYTTTTFNINLSGSSEPFDQTDINSEIIPGAGCCGGCFNQYIFFDQEDEPMDGESGTSVVTIDCDYLGSNTMWVVVKGNNGLVYDVGVDSEPIMITVNVADTSPPTFTWPANLAPMTVDAGMCSREIATPDPMADDNCAFELTYKMVLDGVTTGMGTGVIPADTDFGVGETTITYTATETEDNSDGNSETCSFTVTVTDNEDPVVSCPDDKTVNVDAMSCTATNISDIAMSQNTTGPGSLVAGEYFECNPSVAYTLTGATMGSGMDSNAGDHSGGFNVGITTVEYAITDENQSTTTTCSFDVEVVDNIAPAITCPMDMGGAMAIIPNDCSAIVSYTEPTGTDNCGSTVETTQIAGLPSGSAFPVGTTVNTFMVGSPTGSSESVGPVDNTFAEIAFGSGATNTIDLIFDVNNDVFIENITVYPNPGSGGTMLQIFVTDVNEIEIASHDLTIPAVPPAMMVIPVNFFLPEGDDYRLSHNGAFSLFSHNTSGASYPQNTSGPTNWLSITGTNVFGPPTLDWFYFYNLELKAAQTDECSFNVTVVDNEDLEVIDCPGNMSVNTLLNSCSQTVSWTPPNEFSDNCGITSIEVVAKDKDDNEITLINSFPAGCGPVTDFTGSYSTGAWAIDQEDGDGVVAFTGTTELAVTGSSLVAAENDTEVCIPVLFDGVIQFSYNSDTGGGADDEAFYSINGVQTFIANGVGTQTGTLLIPVEEGDILCFLVTSNGVGSEQTLTISEFSYNCTALQTTGTFPEGEGLDANTVTYTVTDIHGNTGTCSFDIEVKDTQKPSIDCPANNQTIASICAETPITDFTDLVDASDACGLPTITQYAGVSLAPDPEATTLGEIMVEDGLGGLEPLDLVHDEEFEMTFIATDGSGNTEACVITVKLQSGVEPVPTAATPLPTIEETSCGGTYVHDRPTATICNPAATEIEGVITPLPSGVTLSGSTYIFEPGFDDPVTWRYTDPGNASNYAEQTQYFVITADTEVPTCLSKDIEVEVSAVAPATVMVDAEDINMNSSDNCGGTGDLTYMIARDINGPGEDGETFSASLVFTCDDITNPLSAVDVILKTTDSSNNSSYCTAKVTVEDVDAPTFICPADRTFTSSNCSDYTVNFSTTGNLNPTSIMDNCGIMPSGVTNDYTNSATLDGATFTVDDSPFIIEWNVTDIHGLSKTCTQTITINATTGSSFVSCPDDKDVNISADFSPSDCYYTVGDLFPGEFDASVSSFPSCIGSPSATHNYTQPMGLPAISSTSLDGARLPVGTTTITWSIPGGSCEIEITVADDVAPVLTCVSNIILPLPTNGMLDLNSSVAIQELLTNYFDCSTVTLEVTEGDMVDCADVGTDVDISITATDAAGNIAICNTTIEVQDNTVPVALCQAATVYLDNSGNGVLDAELDMDNGSSDACDDNMSYLVALDDVDNSSGDPIPDGIADGPFASTIDFTCADEGVHTVIFKVIDDHGNESTTVCTATVVDDGAPNAECKPYMVMLDALTGEAMVLAGSFDDGSADACNDPVSFLFAIDDVDNFSGDPIPDGLPDDPFAASHSFDCSDLTDESTTFNIILQVTDDASPAQSSTCTTTLTVGHAAPVALCQNYNAILDASGNVTVIPSNLNNSSYDVCGNTLTYQIAEDADNDGEPDAAFGDDIDYGCGDTGDHWVLLEVTDEYGKKDICSSVVTVEDDIHPTLTCAPLTVQLDADGNAQITGSDLLDDVSDNCDIIQLIAEQTQFDCSDVGVHLDFELTATDQNQNSTTCLTTVTVEDNIAPEVITQNIVVTLDASGNGSYNSFEIDDGSNDACGVLNVSASPTTFTCDEVGDNIVVLTVTDNNNNSATGTATVTVIDNIDPTAECMDITVDLDASGMVTVDAEEVDDGSIDACGGGALTYTIAIDINDDGDADDGEVFETALDFLCGDIGDVNVILRVADDNNNTADCASVITIQTEIENVGLAVGDVDGCQTDIVKVPVTVSNFQNMLGVQADFTVIDATVGTVLGVSDFDLDNLDIDDFVINGNEVNMVWFNGSPTTLMDDHVIFNIDVELIGDPNPTDLTSDVNITNAILGQDLCGALVEPAASITNGSVLIDCEPSSIMLTGNVVKAGNLSPVNNVLFTLSGDASGSQMATLPTSSYGFTVDAGLDATITPSKVASPNSGNINIIDLLTIQSNILGTPLPVYKLIAADVTDDGGVNILDLFTIQAFILGAPDFGAVDAWAFVPEDYMFADPTSPTPQSSFENYVNYNPTSTSEDDTFLAIEMGDVTEDAPAPFGATDPMYFYLEDKPVVAGQEYDLTFRAEDFQDIAGYQFTLGFDTDVLSYVSSSAEQLPDLSADQFGLGQLSEGKIPSLWYNIEGLSMIDGEALFTIKFVALQNAAKLSDLLSINTTDIEAFAYTKASDKRDLVLAYTNTTSTSSALDNSFKLFPNTPNPFIAQTTIAYRLEEASTVNVTIMNATGKVVRRIQSDGVVNGYQEVIIDHSDLEGSGVYFYKVETEQHTATGKMTLINR